MYPTEVLALRAWARLFSRSAQHTLVSKPRNYPAAGRCFYMREYYNTSVWRFLFASPQSIKLAVVRISALRVPLAAPAPAEGTQCSAESCCLAIVQPGMTHLQWKVGFPLLPPLFLLFCKQAVCCESSAELMPSGQRL